MDRPDLVQEHPGGVAGEQVSRAGLEEGHVMAGVAGRVDGLESPPVAQVGDDPVGGDCVDTFRGHRQHRAPQPLHVRVQPGGGRPQPGGVDQVRRSLRPDDHPGAGKALRQMPRRPGMRERHAEDAFIARNGHSRNQIARVHRAAEGQSAGRLRHAQNIGKHGQVAQSSDPGQHITPKRGGGAGHAASQVSTGRSR